MNDHTAQVVRTVQRFLTKIAVDPTTDCWNWTASRMPRGYGKFSMGHARWQPAHRVAFELFKGAIPAGLQVDHVCENTSCVNPDHLDAVSSALNSRRIFTRGQDDLGRCVRGHDLTADGAVYIAPSSGKRLCRECFYGSRTTRCRSCGAGRVVQAKHLLDIEAGRKLGLCRRCAGRLNRARRSPTATATAVAR